jgi:hypothetical protein
MAEYLSGNDSRSLRPQCSDQTVAFGNERPRTRETAMPASVQLSLVNELAETVRALSKAFFDPYRPELHYMRGPGPKWRAKHRIDAPVRVAATGPWRVNTATHSAAY